MLKLICLITSKYFTIDSDSTVTLVMFHLRSMNKGICQQVRCLCLWGKIIAVNPQLTVSQAIEILTNAVTVDGEQGLKVIHDKRAVEAAASAK